MEEQTKSFSVEELEYRDRSIYCFIFFQMKVFIRHLLGRFNQNYRKGYELYFNVTQPLSEH